MTTRRVIESTQISTIELYPNPRLEGAWLSSCVLLPGIQSLALGVAGYGIVSIWSLAGGVNPAGIAELCGLTFGSLSFFGLSINAFNVISQPTTKEVTHQPVYFEPDEPEDTPAAPDNTPVVYQGGQSYPKWVDGSPLTFQERQFFGRYRVGQSVTRDEMAQSGCFRGRNLTANYNEFINRLVDAGVLDANKCVTEAGLRWAKSEG